jgi:hypothetical protein
LQYIDRFQNGATYYDPCQSVELKYDAGGAQGAANLLGRVSRALTGPCSSTTPTLYENYSYTPGGLVTSKGFVLDFPQVTDGAGNLNGSYFYDAAMNYSWDSEGHMTGYGSFVYGLDAMGRPASLTESGPGTSWVQNGTYGPGPR